MWSGLVKQPPMVVVQRDLGLEVCDYT
jgi:hypothetical protein